MLEQRYILHMFSLVSKSGPDKSTPIWFLGPDKSVLIVLLLNFLHRQYISSGIAMLGSFAGTHT